MKKIVLFLTLLLILTFGATALAAPGAVAGPSPDKKIKSEARIGYYGISGHQVLANVSVYGYVGDVINVRDYIKPVTTMEFVRCEPETLVLQKNRIVSAKILYKKRQT